MDLYINEIENKVLDSLIIGNNPLNSFEEIISWFTNLKMFASLETKSCNLSEVDSWIIDDHSVHHESGKYFEVLGIKCVVGNRELSKWYQPIIRQREEGITGFIIKNINGTIHLLVQAKLEAGNFDVLEMAPTVQCITGSYSKPEYSVNYLDYFLNKKGKVHYDVMQSEEGGRFFHEQNQNIVIEVDEWELLEIHPNFTWMTFKQAKEFIKFNNYFNIEARSILACFTPV